VAHFYFFHFRFYIYSLFLIAIIVTQNTLLASFVIIFINSADLKDYIYMTRAEKIYQRLYVREFCKMLYPYILIISTYTTR